MVDTLAAAELLVQALTDGLTEAGLPDVLVTTDPDKHAAAALQKAAVIVQPPRLAFGGTLAGDVDAVWRVIIATRPDGAGYLGAWRVIDQVIGAIAETVDVDTAEPGSVPIAGQATALPGYVLTLAPTLI